ncbi:uncharacterized protein BO80DRAFT_431161 [Aspergillus ibericus CBS 121593]|uniref:Uncharacterized protein n=1 Tax=Aspergillus ibericus CBS 121593 TaxID=1448316 RepID=A0A395HCC9_9EURO|nr:hypothetical protein BO80DRAFT_431161 [Aspergillus ibericus CBS 121593]RAL05173.1 hypothetical protein BO80DRAFT_431161 [Aspergillus ibericus CBS 121593]
MAFPMRLLLESEPQAEGIMASQSYRRRGGRSRQQDATNLVGSVQGPNRPPRHHAPRHHVPFRPEFPVPSGGYSPPMMPQPTSQHEGNTMIAQAMQMNYQRREMENWNRMVMDHRQISEPHPTALS